MAMTTRRIARAAAAALIGFSVFASLTNNAIIPSTPQPPSSSSSRTHTSQQQLRRSLLSLPGRKKPHINSLVWPKHIKSFASEPDPTKETVTFWHVPKSGGTTLKEIYKCMGKTLAVRGRANAQFGDETNEKVTFESGSEVIHVDTLTRKGILRAKKLNLVQSGKVDLIVTSGSLNFAIQNLYDESHKGRIIGLFRHPVERLISQFFNRQNAMYNEPEWKEEDIVHWAENIVEEEQNNWLVKTLVGLERKSDVITEEDLSMAIRTMRHKIVIGLTDEMEESIHRFNIFMGVNEAEEDKWQCMNQYFGHGVKKYNSNPHPMVKMGGAAWQAIARKNEFDVRLHMAIVEGFQGQKRIIESYGKATRNGQVTRMPEEIKMVSDDVEEYSNLQRSHEIDRSIEARAQSNNDQGKCSRLFLYLPDHFANHGHGSQINAYLLGVSTATYLDRAMVLVEPPLTASKYESGSQFGCPVDAFRETMTQTTLQTSDVSWQQIHEDFPLGFSRLVKQPGWLSHGCEIPCADNYRYKDWKKLSSGGPLKEITCTNPDGTTANVVVTAGIPLRHHIRDHEPTMVEDYPSFEMWAQNLGATPTEAAIFSNLRDPQEIWDFILGLLNKAGFLQFQPWIARDVQHFLQSFSLPLGEEYDAIHVRRGDKLAFEARDEVRQFWRKKGHTDEEDLPTDYIPFVHYLSQLDGPETCQRNDEGVLQVIKHNVHIATDDPIEVQMEIAALPNHIDRYTILWNECHQLQFFFNPTDAKAFHLNGDGEEGFDEGHEEEAESDSCSERYRRNIASIADMIILSKARTFIGEYNSNWGRVIRTMRLRLNGMNEYMSQGVGEGNVAPTVTLDTRIAWGKIRPPRVPGY